MPKYVKKPEPVQAEQYDPDGDPVDGVVGVSNPGVWSETGWMPVRRGDWVLTHADGRRRVLSDRYFRAYYQPVD